MIDSLKSYVEQIEELPTIPVIAQEILRLLGNDLLTVENLEKIVENDPSISAKVLSVANSAFFGFKVHSDALGMAIMRIGFNNVKNIALGISLITILNDGKSGKASDYQRIFNHSVAVGFTARLLSRNLKLDIAEEVLVNGTLHDIGYLVLNKYFSEKYQEVLIALEAENSLLDAERKVLGFTHSDIGSWLAEKWNLPDTVRDTILYHHMPSQAKKNLKHVAMIHVADYITARNIMGPIEQDSNYPLDPSSLDILGISENDLKDMEESIGGVPFADEIFS
ncbi:MAG: HDOD domain-containing protein [Nitrospiraceae bacterium]|nr:MAG: HDOD domain-containing protein [Nitrospiraceae bacterium]